MNAQAQASVAGTADPSPRAFIGRTRTELPTPALLLDVDAMRDNIAAMASWSKENAAIRPHFKTHKSIDVAREQIAAGAIGMTAATIWEARALVAAGIDDILIANEVVAPAKLTLLADLGRQARMTVAVDDSDVVSALAQAARSRGSSIEVLVEVDVGMHRGGARSVELARALARAVAGAQGVRLRGVMGYEGHVVLEPDRQRRADQAGRMRQQPTRHIRAGLQNFAHIDRRVAVGEPPREPAPDRKWQRSPVVIGDERSEAQIAEGLVRTDRGSRGYGARFHRCPPTSGLLLSHRQQAENLGAESHQRGELCSLHREHLGVETIHHVDEVEHGFEPRLCDLIDVRVARRVGRARFQCSHRRIDLALLAAGGDAHEHFPQVDLGLEVVAPVVAHWHPPDQVPSLQFLDRIGDIGPRHPQGLRDVIGGERAGAEIEQRMDLGD